MHVDDVIMYDEIEMIDLSTLLPQEVWNKIFSLLDIKSCIRLSLSSKLFHNVISTLDIFWRREYFLRNSNNSSVMTQSLLEAPLDAEFTSPGSADVDSRTKFWRELTFSRARFETCWKGSETYLQETDAMFTAKTNDKVEISCMHAVVDSWTRDFFCCVLGMTDGHVYIWDTRRRECSITFENAHADGILDAKIVRTNNNEFNVLSGSKDGIIKLWNPESGNLIHQYNLPVPRSRRCRGIFFPREPSNQPRHFYQSSLERSFFVSYDHLVNHYDLESGRIESVFGEPAEDGPGWVTCFASVAPSLIATAGSSRKVSMWDLRCPEKPVSMIQDQHKEWIRCLQVHGWNQSLATGSTDAMVRIFDLRKQNVVVSSFGPHAGSKQRPARINSLQMDFDKLVSINYAYQTPKVCVAKRTIYAYDLHTERRLFFKTPLPSGKYTDFELKVVNHFYEQVITAFTTDDRAEVRLFQVKQKQSDDMDIDDIQKEEKPADHSRFKRLRKRH